MAFMYRCSLCEEVVEDYNTAAHLAWHRREPDWSGVLNFTRARREPRRVVTPEEDAAERDARAAKAAIMAVSEGAPAGPAIEPAHEDMTAMDIRLGVFRGGPLDTLSWDARHHYSVSIPVPARPCLHVHAESPADWGIVWLSAAGEQLRMLRDLDQMLKVMGEPIGIVALEEPRGPHRYLYAGRTIDGGWLYDYAGQVDPWTGCVPPARVEPPKVQRPSAVNELLGWAEYHAVQGNPAQAVECADAAWKLEGLIPQ